jgi:hypothetical protein
MMKRVSLILLGAELAAKLNQHHAGSKARETDKQNSKGIATFLSKTKAIFDVSPRISHRRVICA